jgi:subtilisin family serine protease
MNINGEGWANQIGLTESFRDQIGFHIPIVAVIDSGIDYNHPILHSSLWLNETPGDKFGKGMGGHPDYYGWDFISGDSRPFDDGYHGTEVSSLVVAASQSKIMPLKVFNPWGVTNSASIYSAIAYAVDHGAKIILCAWSTLIRSRALEQGIQYARANGVVVIAAAGDQGQDLNRYGTYPGAFSKEYDNVLTVAGVDSNNLLFKSRNRASNYHGEWVKIAAPAIDIRVARPRNEYGQESSSGMSAAIVAGVLGQSWVAQGLNLSQLERSPETASKLIRRFLNEQTESAQSLQGYVEAGRVLRIHE